MIWAVTNMPTKRIHNVSLEGFDTIPTSMGVTILEHPRDGKQELKPPNSHTLLEKDIETMADLDILQV